MTCNHKKNGRALSNACSSAKYEFHYRKIEMFVRSQHQLYEESFYNRNVPEKMLTDFKLLIKIHGEQKQMPKSLSIGTLRNRSYKLTFIYSSILNLFKKH